MHAIRKLRESGHATAADYETILAANVVFHSPVLIRTVEGRTAVAKIFAASWAPSLFSHWPLPSILKSRRPRFKSHAALSGRTT